MGAYFTYLADQATAPCPALQEFARVARTIVEVPQPNNNTRVHWEAPA